MKPIFVTGIGTGIGKTIISAILVEMLKADYWKPIQSGDLADSDTLKVKNLISNEKSFFHPEAYRLTQPFSPHKSAELDGVEIKLENFVIPKIKNQLIIEGAGGLMVPLNEESLMIDLIEKFEAEVILVVQHYLGSINHTLLSTEILKTRNISLKGIIFNGFKDDHSEKAISTFSKSPVLARIPKLDVISKETILIAAGSFNFSVL